MNKKLKSAFSLAELMITLLILSIILSAVMPAVTKRNASVEEIWRWCQNATSSVHFGEGRNQSVLIGVADMPASDGSAGIYDFNYDGTNLTTAGDKLVLFKRKASDTAHSMANSHITFFSADDNGLDADYAGRLAMERTNIALGKYALAKLDTPDYSKDGTDDEVLDRKNNLAIGHNAMKFNNNGHSNVAIGNGTLTTGDAIKGSTAIGYNALNKTTTGSYNTAIGLQAGENNTTATGNTLIGAQALRKTATGDANTVVGYLALSKTQEASNSNRGNVVIGASAAYTTGSANSSANVNNNNVVIGAQAGQNAAGQSASGSNVNIATNFNNNVLIGKDTGKFLGTIQASNNNVMIGFQSGLKAYSATNNIFLGPLSGYTASGSNNIYIGSKAGYNNDETSNNTGEDNIFIGQNSGAANTEGQNNVFLGFESGKANTTGTGNVYLGYKAGSEATTESHKLEIASNGNSLIKGDFGDSASSVEPSLDFTTNKITLGKTSGSVEIHLETADKLDFKLDNFAFGESETANVTVGSGGVTLDKPLTITGNLTVDSSNSFYTHGKEIVALIQQYVTTMSSDIRLKNVKGEATEGLSAIDALKVVKFTYKQDEQKQEHIGVIAQDLQKVIPSAVVKNEDGFLSVKFTDVLYSAVKAIQELHKAVIELAQNVKSLELKICSNSDKIQKLEKENKELKQQLKTLEKRMEKAGI